MATSTFPKMILSEDDMPYLCCIECQQRMIIVKIEPVSNKHEIQRFRCYECGLTESYVVELFHFDKPHKTHKMRHHAAGR